MRNLRAFGKGDGRLEIGAVGSNVEITFFDSGTNGKAHIFTYVSDDENPEDLAQRIHNFLSDIVRQQYIEQAFEFNRSTGKEL